MSNADPEKKAKGDNARRGSVDFNKIMQAELRAILERRNTSGEAKDALENSGNAGIANTDHPIKMDDLVGVACSGGGIRSACFSLGALQALNAYGAIGRIDYLSTVSGGGYIGASMVANMKGSKDFPFAEDAELRDSAPVSHIRDNSRYLFPHGLDDVLRSIGILARGLVVNAILILSVVLSLATLTILANPTAIDLQHSFLAKLWIYFGGNPGSWITPYLQNRFLVTQVLLVLTALHLTAWGLYRSAVEQWRIQSDWANKPEYSSSNARFSKYLVTALVTAFIAESQTLIIEWIIALHQRTNGFELTSIISWLTALTGASTVLTLFRDKLMNVIAKALNQPTMGAAGKALLAKTLLYVGALMLPAAIYLLYLFICAAGIAFKGPCPPNNLAADVLNCGIFDPSSPEFPMLFKWVKDDQTLLVQILALLLCIVAAIGIAGSIRPDAKAGLLRNISYKVRQKPLDALWRAAVCLVVACVIYITALAVRAGLPDIYRTVLLGFAELSGIFIVIGMGFSENANALHGLYRDRLNWAFALGKTPDQRTTLWLKDLDTKNAPYLLINATLNARRSELTHSEPKTESLNFSRRPSNINQGVSPALAAGNTMSASAFGAGSHPLPTDPTKRGRNADFFLFSKNYIGSDSTGYALPDFIWPGGKGLDVATAVAISGAAVSSNNGRLGLGVLAPTLALLNARLGYWMNNPKYAGHAPKEIKQTWFEVFRLYLLQEAFGLLRTDSKKVYLSDGGHIENLGLYQLLKRRCKVIIVLDGEADPALNFGAFADAQRFARIDLGCRVSVDWQEIRRRSAERMKDLKKAVDKNSSDHFMHFAIGEIFYSDSGKEEDKGILLYVKANMTGDEADYVTDYERRYPTFPHETTIDQLFSEEQMEAYRALGFHSLSRALSVDNGYIDAETAELVGEVRGVLGIAKSI